VNLMPLSRPDTEDAQAMAAAPAHRPVRPVAAGLAALEQETAALRERLDQLERLLRDAGIGVPKPRRRG